MEKIKKFLLRLSKQERNKLEGAISRIVDGNLGELDVKKLKGHTDVFRARVGKIRVIFRIKGSENYILEISRRNDSTCKKH